MRFRLQAQIRAGHGVQTRLALPGQAREDHGNVIAGMLIAGAGDDDARALDAAVVARGIQFHGHFGPGAERRWAAKFDAAFVNDDRFGGQIQTGLARLKSHLRLK